MTPPPQIWYVIPPAYAEDFEMATDAILEPAIERLNTKPSNAPSTHQTLNAYRSKSIFPPISHLLNHKVPIFRIIQQPGDYVITFPRCYHGGFSLGVNVGEAVNFGVAAWLPFAERAELRAIRLPESEMHKLEIVNVERMIVKEVVY